MREKRKIIQNYIDNKQLDLAIKELLEIIEEEPTASNFSYVSRKSKELEYEELGYNVLRVAFLRSFTIEPVIQYLEVRCLQERILLKTFIGGYNSFQQEILDINSELDKFSPDIVILAIRPQELCPRLIDSFLELSKEEVEMEVKNVLHTIETLLSFFRDLAF